MANRSKQKGTSAETELLRLMNLEGMVRTPASSRHDLDRPGIGAPLEVLGTRPDRGQWLITLRLDDFLRLLSCHDKMPLHVEVKRHASFAIHTIFESKFGAR